MEKQADKKGDREKEKTEAPNEGENALLMS
jgi:hypothetical protein